MEDIKKRLSQKKRNRTQSQNIIKSIQTISKQKYIININNIEYSISLKLPLEKNMILIECSPKNTQIKYETNIKLEEIKEKCRIFNICKNLEEVFKIFNNCFNSKKVILDEKNSDSINLILIVPNYIDNIEENVYFNLIRSNDNNSPVIKLKKIDNNELLDNLMKDNNEIKLGLGLIQKITDLTQNDIAIENFLNKLICLWKGTMKEIKEMKEDIELIKKHIGIEKKYNKKEEKNLNKDDINDIQIGIMNEESKEIEEKEEEELEEEEEEEENEDEKEKSRFKFNEQNDELEDFDEKDDTEKEKGRETLKDNFQKPKSEIKPVRKLAISQMITPFTKSTLISNNSNNLNSRPKLSFCKNIIKKSLVKYLGDNNFIVFETINKEIILVFGSIRNTINFFDIEKEIIIKSIPDAHKSQVTNFRYAKDTNYSRDLLLSIADTIKNIKIWDINTLTCILNIEEVYFSGFLFSACFLIDEINKRNYVISVNYNSEPLKIFSLEGKNLFSQIRDIGYKIYYVDTFFNKVEKKYYIILGCETCIISLNFEEQTIYKKYHEKNSECVHMYFSINCKGKEVLLIDSDLNGYIRIWDFDNGKMINKYSIGKKLKLRGMCLWNENYVFVGASDKNVKLVDLRNGEVIENLKCYDNISTIKKIYSYIYGECLLLQGRSNNGQIKLWKK